MCQKSHNKHVLMGREPENEATLCTCILGLNLCTSSELKCRLNCSITVWPDLNSELGSLVPWTWVAHVMITNRFRKHQ